MRRVALTALLALVVPAVAAAATVRIGAADRGRTLSLHRGDVLVVSLPSNPSTGYGWYVKRRDARVLGFAGRKFVSRPNPRHLVGGGGTEVLRFRALERGSTGLRLEYVRPFDPKHPAGSFRVKVVVA